MTNRAQIHDFIRRLNRQIYQGNGSLEQMQTFSTIYPKLRQLDQKHRDMDICFKDKHCVSTNRHLNIMFFLFKRHC